MCQFHLQLLMHKPINSIEFIYEMKNYIMLYVYIHMCMY